MNLQEKQAAILAEGKRRRGNFSPAPGSAPLRAYNYWAENGGTVPKQENFCHFWRVVVIWAPIYWLIFNVVEPIFTNRVSRAVGRGIAWVFETPYKAYTNKWTLSQRRKFWDRLGITLVSMIGVALLVVVGTLFVMNFGDAWLPTLLVFGGVATLFAVIIGLAYVYDELKTRYDAKRFVARQEAIENGNFTWAEPKEPGRVKKFFRGIGDFFTLIAQIIRVKKWKICPLVQIPTTD